MLRFSFATIFLALSLTRVQAWCPNDSNTQVSRRQVFSSATTAALVGAAITGNSLPSLAFSGDYENRDRRSNKDAVIREDYYWMMGKTPPRSLKGALRMDDPQWNAFGSCETTESGASSNSCTYVSLKQRIPAYSKYGFNIGLAAKEYKLLGMALQDAARTNSEQSWASAASYVTTLPQSPPPPPVDAMLKMVLFASAMLTSPNFNGPSRELLVTRFYTNEASYALKEISAAIEARDGERAMAAWDFGKDSWNSYFQLVNGRISSKVGDKFQPIDL
jgi:hypothetical protein